MVLCRLLKTVLHMKGVMLQYSLSFVKRVVVNTHKNKLEVWNLLTTDLSSQLLLLPPQQGGSMHGKRGIWGQGLAPIM